MTEVAAGREGTRARARSPSTRRLSIAVDPRTWLGRWACLSPPPMDDAANAASSVAAAAITTTVRSI